MSEALIIQEKKEGVGTLRLNRPEVLNALNCDLMKMLAAGLTTFDSDPDIGCILIAGSERAFAAGADLRDMADASPFEMIGMEYIEQWDTFSRIKKPVIAAVSGWCLGGGCELALACDMIVASETARFGQPEITLGMMTGAGASQRLARTVGKALTMEMVLNNRHLDAQEALQYGLVNRVFTVEQYYEGAFKLASEIASRAPLAVLSQKQAVRIAFESSLQQGMAAERQLFYTLFSSQDRREGIQAFLEKRSPDWHGQ